MDLGEAITFHALRAELARKVGNMSAFNYHTERANTLKNTDGIGGAVMNGKWMYNKTRDEIWDSEYYNSRRKAIAAGKKEYPNQNFYIGQCERIEIPVEADAEKIIERIGEAIDDNHSLEVDFGEDFYNEAMEHHDELQKLLKEVVKEWLDKHKFCESCFVIRNTELIVWPW